MSRDRIASYAGWQNRRTGKCRRCGTAVPKGRRTFCGEACVHQHKICTQPAYVRKLVWERDAGVCRACGLDTKTLPLPRGETRTRYTGRGGGWAWQADHIVEVQHGGGECGIENYQTLCTSCHRAKTKRNRKKNPQQLPLF